MTSRDFYPGWCSRLGLVGLLCSATLAWAADSAPPTATLDWRQLPDFPQPVGGSFAGISDGRLVVAGGALFPTPLFESGTKVWVADVFALSADQHTWQRVGELPHPRAYGASITLDSGILLIGGGDAETHVASVTLLRLEGERLTLEEWPPLPKASAFLGAARLGKAIYAIGGRATPDAPQALKTCWRLDLSNPTAGWKEIPSWDGPARLLPVVTAQDKRLIVASGAELVQDSNGETTRRYLTDTYIYQPGVGWRAGATLPHPVVAAPNTVMGDTHVLVFGGDDGALADKVWELKDTHPGFRKEILAYHTVTNTWRTWSTLPSMPNTTGTPVTTNAVWLGDRLVIPTGEDRPGHRTASVLSFEMPQAAAAFKKLDYVLLAIYLGLLVWMGFYFSKREKTTDDFFLGGRRVPWWAAGMSIFGTQLSAITFMAIPAKSFATNWTFVLVNLCIVLITPLVVFFYLPFFRRLKITTAYEYLEQRFNMTIRLFGSLSFIMFQVGRMGIVLFLPAIALSTVTGLDIYFCILVMGVLCTVYTVMGGIEAVIWTDVLQVIVLMGGALLSLIVIVMDTQGGMNGLLEVARHDDKLHTFNWTWDYTVAAVWVMMIGNLFSNLVPYTTDQTVVQRYLTTRDEKAAAKAIWTNAILTVPAAIIFFGVGTALYGFYKLSPEELNPVLKSDGIFPWFVAKELPAGVSGIVIAGLFAAAMSSLDSSMNSVAAVITTDYYRLRPRERSDASGLRLARVLTVILGIVGTATAALMASYEVKSLWDLFLRFIGLFGGSIAGIFALGIFTKRGNSHGALIGALAGVVAVFAVQQYTAVHFMLYAAVGIAVSFGVGLLTSLIIPMSLRDLTDLTLYTRKPEGA